ncbi:MAG: trehalose-phosphatase [Pseudomonadota bacterium]
MSRSHPFEAVVTDMDGVLTRTADIHERAWKRVFDEVLRAHAGDGFEPFSGADYRRHVDGKPRYDGVADFLAARGLALDRGTPSDPPEADTICGIGNRKNRLFLELLECEGVRVFDDAVAALHRWRRGGLPLAIISGSRNCREILAAAGLEDAADVVVDGVLAEALELGGKAGILREAARRLDVAPGDAVVFEDATSGVRAARETGFGRIFGVSRNRHEQALRDAGADAVVERLDCARFVRRVPPLLARLPEWSRWQGDRCAALFLDFDGTLAPIVDDPGAARMPEATRAALAALARRGPVAIISGRDRGDVYERVDMPGLLYAGSHGFDIEGRGVRMTLPEAEDAVDDVARAEDALRRELHGIDGVILERKRFSLAIHYRQVRDPDAVARVRRVVEDVGARTRLRGRTGKMVLELEPAVAWDKGRALRWIMDVMEIDLARHFPAYIGDDVTDEDAFAALGGDGAGVRVGDPVSESLADYSLADPAEVRALLEWLGRNG